MRKCLTRIAVVAAIAFSPSVGWAFDNNVTTNRVRMYWNFGVTNLDLFGNDSPLHVENFLGYVERGDYDNTFIHRSVSGSSRFLQGGGFYAPPQLQFSLLEDQNLVEVPEDDPVPNEFDPSNGLSNIEMSIGAARTSDPDSARSQWFINITDNSGFDSGPFTVFGRITSGWESVTPLLDEPLVQDFLPANNPPPINIAETAILIEEPGATSLVTLLTAVEVSTVDGDYNLDLVVDGADYALWQDNIGSTTALAIDGNGNGVVDAGDYDVWRANFGEAAPLRGDFNGDSVVDGADYAVWRDSLGATDQPLIDVDGSGTVDFGDYDIWRSEFGQTVGAAQLGTSPNAVPEPSSVAVMLGAIVLAGMLRARLRASF